MPSAGQDRRVVPAGIAGRCDRANPGAKLSETGERFYVENLPGAGGYAFAKRETRISNSSRSLAIGDSIEHDIRGGQRADLATALVLTGLVDGELDKRLASYGATPDFVMPSLRW